jgi:hypothetical protein
MLVQQHITASHDTEGIKLFIEGKRNTLVKCITYLEKESLVSEKKFNFSKCASRLAQEG